MNDFSAATFASSLISVAGIWLLLYWRYRRLTLDWYRQKLFAVRDSAFDAALEGHVSFDSTAYGMFRSVINGQIHFAHRVSFWQFLIFGLQVRLLAAEDARTKDFSARWVAALGKLDAKGRKCMEERFKEMHMLMIAYIIIASPTLLAILTPVAMCLIAVQAFTTVWDKLIEKLRPSFVPIDSVAFACAEAC